MSATLDCKDIGIRKSEFVTKTQFLWKVATFNSDRKKIIQILQPIINDNFSTHSYIVDIS